MNRNQFAHLMIRIAIPYGLIVYLIYAKLPSFYNVLFKMVNGGDDPKSFFNTVALGLLLFTVFKLFEIFTLLKEPQQLFVKVLIFILSLEMTVVTWLHASSFT